MKICGSLSYCLRADFLQQTGELLCWAVLEAWRLSMLGRYYSTAKITELDIFFPIIRTKETRPSITVAEIPEMVFGCLRLVKLSLMLQSLIMASPAGPK